MDAKLEGPVPMSKNTPLSKQVAAEQELSLSKGVRALPSRKKDVVSSETVSSTLVAKPTGQIHEAKTPKPLGSSPRDVESPRQLTLDAKVEFARLQAFCLACRPFITSFWRLPDLGIICLCCSLCWFTWHVRVLRCIGSNAALIHMCCSLAGCDNSGSLQTHFR